MWCVLRLCGMMPTWHCHAMAGASLLCAWGSGSGWYAKPSNRLPLPEFWLCNPLSYSLQTPCLKCFNPFFWLEYTITTLNSFCFCTLNAAVLHRRWASTSSWHTAASRPWTPSLHPQRASGTHSAVHGSGERTTLRHCQGLGSTHTTMTSRRRALQACIRWWVCCVERM